MLPKVVRDSFLMLENEMDHMADDIRYSGSTCSAVLIFGRKIYAVNLGDSRVLLVKKGNDHSKELEKDGAFKQLTREHNLLDEEERDRVLEHGGRIDFFRDKQGAPQGPPRVWLRHGEQPGLAMTRAFGDAIGRSVGVISVPEIKTVKMHLDDKILVLATDGIWGFLSNQQVADIVYPYYFKNDPEGASAALISRASEQWKQIENGITDDMTCVVVFLANLKN